MACNCDVFTSSMAPASADRLRGDEALGCRRLVQAAPSIRTTSWLAPARCCTPFSCPAARAWALAEHPTSFAEPMLVMGNNVRYDAVNHSGNRARATSDPAVRTGHPLTVQPGSARQISWRPAIPPGAVGVPRTAARRNPLMRLGRRTSNGYCSRQGDVNDRRRGRSARTRLTE